ncbi:MAG: hypothetical protein A3E38_01815 [Candidatus Moranbacteria bacterium RIFCSPHIGHO2_12_FULL_54_9]|nr:MAG: hypothetical protein A2878_02550 [Candidatus Moranbacteria bacterium RIFCSPHIGHO2_01_FULL_54_31]OGI26418.1 MAG: hypothetical protein A3E38_01815 [Candidatus Moranbacteria bacterium RIFCSPHIGHO2_12_FULL_54_9]
MEEKKTTKTPTKDPQNSWTAFLLDNIFQSIQSFVDGAVESVHQATRAFTRRLVRGTFLLLFAFLGIIFLLVGLAELLSAAYQFPGSGETIVGIFILFTALILYIFTRDDY